MAPALFGLLPEISLENKPDTTQSCAETGCGGGIWDVVRCVVDADNCPLY